MSRSISDINAKIAYLTNRQLGPALKAKNAFVLDNKLPSLKRKETGACKKELAELLECINEHSDNTQCAEYFTALLNCDETHAKARSSAMKKLLKGEKVGGRYHPAVMENLLNQYPESRNKKAEIIQRNWLNTLPESRTQEVPYHDEGRPFKKRT